jgi:hypothetical protein
MESFESIDSARFLLSHLDWKAQSVVYSHYWLGLTMAECGKLLGVTGTRSSQIHRKALLRLRNTEYLASPGIWTSARCAKKYRRKSSIRPRNVSENGATFHLFPPERLLRKLVDNVFSVSAASARWKCDGTGLRGTIWVLPDDVSMISIGDTVYLISGAVGGSHTYIVHSINGRTITLWYRGGDSRRLTN